MTTPYNPLRPAFAWCGGKQKLVRQIMPHLPWTDVYCEPFAGALSILLARPPAKVETINDLNGDVVNFYRVLQDTRLRARLIDRLYYTPYARAELELALATLAREDATPLERAWAFFVKMRQGHGGMFTDKGWGTNKLRRSSAISAFYLSVSSIDYISSRIKKSQIENRPAAQVFKAFDNAKCLTYLDPPYFLTAQPYGTPPFGHAEWTELRDLCLQAKGAVALSTTPNDYAQALIDAGWQCVELTQLQCVDKNTATRATRLEWLVLNPRCQELNRQQKGELAI